MSTPLFNLALAQRERGETEEAAATLEQAIERRNDAAYLVLKAKLAEDGNDRKKAKKCLKEAFETFDPVCELTDWELQWYVSATKMAGDKKKLKKAENERKRRLSSKNESAQEDSVLPAVKAGALKEC